MILTKKQTVCLDSLENISIKEIIFGGGAGSAKSVIGCFWLLKMCLKYPETRWLMGRAKLKTLKETTLNTFLWVCKQQGIINGTHFNINNSSNIIKFNNGSEILMKDLFFYPSDPQFDELGSLEITGAFIDEVNQIVKLAWDIVKSRIRYKLDDYGLAPTILGSCNPSKNWVYKDFYKLSKDKKLEKQKMFIQALVSDNPYISKHYIDNLNDLPKAQRDRLLLGLWESDDDTQLPTQDNIIAIFDNEWIKVKGTHYLTGDIARMGSDKAVLMVWEGLTVIEVVTFAKSKFDLLHDTIKNLKLKYKISNANIILDADGVGGFLVDAVKAKEFINNAKALNDEQFQNLKTQCYYKLAEMINKKQIYISPNVLTTLETELLIEELEQIKEAPTDDTKLRIINKAEVKSNIGRSPDYSDSLMMRMYYELTPKLSTLSQRFVRR